MNHEGKHYTVRKAKLLPTPVKKPRIPIWIGGMSAGALRRAARWDGWVPEGPAKAARFPGLEIEQLTSYINRINSFRGDRDPITVIYTMDIPLVQEERRTVLTELEDIGVSRVLDHIYGFRFDEKLH